MMESLYEMCKYSLIEATLLGYDKAEKNEFILEISKWGPICKREFYGGLEDHIYGRTSKTNLYRGLPNGGKGDTLYSNKNSNYKDTIKNGKISYDIKRLKKRKTNIKDIETFMRENVGNTVYYYVLQK